MVNSKYFPTNPRKALLSGFKHAEQHFLTEVAEKAEEQRRLRQSTESDSNKFNLKYLDCSGSCALVALIVDDHCYIANVGDSRALLSADTGDKIYVLTNDHKPTEENELKRIVDNGGRVYQTQTTF